MYYKYKSKKKGGKSVKIIIFLILAGILFLFLYSKRDKFKFWKYSFSKLEREYNAVSIYEGSGKSDKLVQLLKKLQKSHDENPSDTKTLFLLAGVDFQLGEISYGKNFARIIVDDRNSLPASDASVYFINSMKHFKKILSINEDKTPEDNVLLMLSKLYYYMGYYSQDEIYALLKKIRKPELLTDDDRRFYGYMNYIVSGDEQYVSYLSSIETDTNLGKLFMAGVYFKSKQYTNAILQYKGMLENEMTEDERDIVQRNLGKIYFYQSLMDESLQFLLPVYQRDPGNKEIREMLYKIYSEKGDKASSKLYAPI